MSVGYLQSVAGTNSFGGTASSTLSGTVAHNMILACVQWYINTGGTAVTLSGVSDSNGTYTKISSSYETSAAATHYVQLATEWAYITNIAGGSVTATATFSGSGAYAFVTLFELSGYDTGTPVDQVSINTGTLVSATSASAGTVNTNRNGEFGGSAILIDDGSGAGSIFTKGSGWTSMVTNAGGGNAEEGVDYISQSSSGSLIGNMTFTSRSGVYVASMVTIQPPASNTGIPGALCIMGCGAS